MVEGFFNVKQLLLFIVSLELSHGFGATDLTGRTSAIRSKVSFPSSISIPSLDMPAGPWTNLKHLVDKRNGDFSPHLVTLKIYLSHFGYLPPDLQNVTSFFDDTTEAAVRLYQNNFKLTVTGELNVDTILQMMTPRCGREDVIVVSYSNEGEPPTASPVPTKGLKSVYLYSHFPGDPKWTLKTNLTYWFFPVNETSRVTEGDRRQAIAGAFSAWAAVVPLTFTEVESVSNADIKISFNSLEHGDGSSFDGVLGILAHSFAPEDGRFHFDNSEYWTVDVNSDDSLEAIDLQTVAIHEIGHLLGMGHSSDRTAIMFPSIMPRQVRTQLTVDDISGVQVLYGQNPNIPSTSFQMGQLSSSGISLQPPLRLTMALLLTGVLVTACIKNMHDELL